MKKHLLLVYFLLFAKFLLQAQQTNTATDTGSYARLQLRVSPVRFIIREPAIGLEWRKQYRYSHEIRAGFVYPQIGMRALYENFLTVSTARYMGPLIGYQWRRWKKHKSGYDKYFMLSATYRSLWFNKQWIWLGGASGSSFISNLNLSQRRQDLLLQFAFHGPATMPKKLQFEIGLGAMIMYTKSYVHGCTLCNPNDPNYEAILVSNRNYLFAPEGFFAIPWLHFNFSLPYVLR